MLGLKGAPVACMAVCEQVLDGLVLLAVVQRRKVIVRDLRSPNAEGFAKVSQPEMQVCTGGRLAAAGATVLTSQGHGAVTTEILSHFANWNDIS